MKLRYLLSEITEGLEAFAMTPFVGGEDTFDGHWGGEEVFTSGFGLGPWGEVEAERRVHWFPLGRSYAAASVQ